MKDYNLNFAEIAADIITDCLGKNLTSHTYYSADRNSIIMEFSGYPLRESDRTGNVYVQFPRKTFFIKRGNVYFTPIRQTQCRYYQESMGNQFAHPHVYIDGHPSWDNLRRNTPADFITNIIETLSLQNVTKDSIALAYCSSGIMGTGSEALKNAQGQQARVINVLKCNPFICDHIKLERYVDQSWRDKLMTFMNSGDTSRVVFENRKGVTAVCVIDMADSPIEIIRKFYEEDFKMALYFFEGPYALSRFLKPDSSDYSEANSCFELINIEGDSIKVNWRIALCDQLEIKEEMKNIVNNNQVPTFFIYVGQHCVA